MRTCGEPIEEGHKRARLTQREPAARIRSKDGRLILPRCLNNLEHDLRKVPRDHLIEQFAMELHFQPDPLYFAARRVPEDIESGASEAQVLAAYARGRHS